jgi:hypothetical protein
MNTPRTATLDERERKQPSPLRKRFLQGRQRETGPGGKEQRGMSPGEEVVVAGEAGREGRK